MNLTPEDRQRIYEEEKARAEPEGQVNAVKDGARARQRRATKVVCLVIMAVVVGQVAYLHTPVSVQTGRVVRCLDTHHPGSPIIRSTVQTLRVPRKDAGRYSVVQEALVCEKCQVRRNAEEVAATKRRAAEEVAATKRRAADERAANARREVEGGFARAVWIHDAAVYACIKRFVSATQEGSVSQGRRQMRRLRGLAYGGMKLHAPASLKTVQGYYQRSMDEHLRSISWIEEGLREGSDFEYAMAQYAIHTSAARTYRDKAIDALKRRGYRAPPGIISYTR